MDEFITVRAVSLRQLFSGEYAFHLPWFQRAYAWQTVEAGRLLTSLFDLLDATDQRRPYYSLGRLMLAKKPGDSTTALVDGHQRVMTLMLLFAVLRDVSKDPASQALLQSFIGGSEYRLKTQDNLLSFCDQYVQVPGATSQSPDVPPDALSETERNIIENRDYFKTELSSSTVSASTQAALIQTLADRCFVVVKELTDEDEAWRMLEIEENTQRPFNAANRAKASLLSIMPLAEREACRRIWENCERMLGSHDMFAVLGHVRTLKLRKRSERPIETDLAQRFALNSSGLNFMQSAIAPAAMQLHALRRHEVGTLRTRAAIGGSIERLSWVSRDLWVPAALRWLDQRGEDGETELFFARMERLVWILRLAGIDPLRQQRHIIRLIDEIDKGHAVAAITELEIPKTLRESAYTNLRSATFDSKHYAAKVLRRIGLEFGEDPGPICPVKVTVEHILPRGWLDASNWRRNFKTEKAVRSHAHRLGNLTFLSAIDNRAADSCDWPDKKKIYSKSAFEMTRDMANIDDWNAQAIDARTDRLARRLFKSWDLET